ncbi:MAG: glycosyltransferase family 87 protein [Candidatus Limnocylindrales bacterium]
MIRDHPLLGRPALVAIAALNAITGLAAAAVLAPLSFGGDVDVYRRGAEGIAHGVIAQDFLYAPLFGLLLTPLTWVPFATAAWVMALLGATVLAIGIVVDTRGGAPVDRVLVAVAAFGFLPVVNDLILGQVTLLIAAAIYPVRQQDGFGRGVALGIVVALIPKPLLLPVLAWMLIRRRRALAATAMTAILVTALGAGILGTDLYRLWAEALVHAGQVSRNGNLALGSLGQPVLVIGAWVLVALAAAWIIVRREPAGFVAALLAGLLLAPYTLLYAASILLLAVRPALRVSPVATRILALTANLGLVIAFVPWGAAALAAMGIAGDSDVTIDI